MTARPRDLYPVKDPLGSYPKLLRLLDHYFAKEDVVSRQQLQALNTIVELNEEVLRNPKSANARSIRSSDSKIKNMIDGGGTDVLQEVGWVYKVQSMEESWVLPYDADLERLRTQHEKIVQCHHRLQERYDAMEFDVKQRMAKEQSAKVSIIRQIEADKKDREEKLARQKGIFKPTLSLDEQRKQAIKERMQREAAKKAQPQTAVDMVIPGSYPQLQRNRGETRRLDEDGDVDNDVDNDEEEEEEEKEEEGGPKRGDIKDAFEQHLGSRMRSAPRKRVAKPQPIELKKTEKKDTYRAGTHILGGEEGSKSTSEIEPMGADDMLSGEDDKIDEDDY